MIGLLQRVSSARVDVGGETVGAIQRGLMVLVCAERGDAEMHAERLLAPPEEGRRLFEHMLRRAQAAHPVVQAGRFGADMQVTLTNDGPVTIWLRIPPEAPAEDG
jgi:D-tyrosyl-tRNA(Tyr) deacylase